jgi:hypothetical protein
MIVEDGTGLADANSYLSVAEADAYWAARGNANWAAATTVAKEAALVNASMYVDLRWGTSITGTPVSSHQILVFPRNGLPACARGQTFPLRLKWAVAEYAVLALAGPLAPTPEVSARTKYRVKVGPLEEETTYATEVGTGSIGMWRVYPLADSLMACLAEITTVGANQGRQMRA